MSDVAFNSVLTEVDSFSYDQCITLLEKISEVLRGRSFAKSEADDLFYSEKNMKHLLRGAQAIKNGQGKEHELVEVE